MIIAFSNIYIYIYFFFSGELSPKMHIGKKNQKNLPLESLLVQALHVHPIRKEGTCLKCIYTFASTVVSIVCLKNIDKSVM